MLFQYLRKINLYYLSSNPNAISLLEENCDKIGRRTLSLNPNAIHMLEANPDIIDWELLSYNPSIFELDYNILKQRMQPIKHELLTLMLSPTFIKKYGKQLGVIDHDRFNDCDQNLVGCQ